jgi:predicted transcriptional regulator
MAKEVQMSIKLEADLRTQFMQVADKVHRPAAQIIREMMRAFITAHEEPNDETINVMKEIENGKFNTYKSADQLYRKLGI